MLHGSIVAIAVSLCSWGWGSKSHHTSCSETIKIGEGKMLAGQNLVYSYVELDTFCAMGKNIFYVHIGHGGCFFKINRWRKEKKHKVVGEFCPFCLLFLMSFVGTFRKVVTLHWLLVEWRRRLRINPKSWISRVLDSLGLDKCMLWGND